jgi:hypothetical protein
MGIPAAWLPFVVLNLACMVAWARAEAGEAYGTRFLGVALLTCFFTFDQIIVFQRSNHRVPENGRYERDPWGGRAAHVSMPGRGVSEYPALADAAERPINRDVPALESTRAPYLGTAAETDHPSASIGHLLYGGLGAHGSGSPPEQTRVAQ